MRLYRVLRLRRRKAEASGTVMSPSATMVSRSSSIIRPATSSGLDVRKASLPVWTRLYVGAVRVEARPRGFPPPSALDPIWSGFVQGFRVTGKASGERSWTPPTLLGPEADGPLRDPLCLDPSSWGTGRFNAQG